MEAPLPLNESQRLAALRSYAILDSGNEPEFDDIVKLASEICGVPISAISFVDEHRQWFKAICGLDVQEMDRKVSFCAHAIHDTEIMSVQDAREDSRFANNDLVTGALGLRFYAGTPLIDYRGNALGALCVIDIVPRELTEQQKHSLKILGNQVIQLLELRRAARQLHESYYDLVEQEEVYRNVVNSVR
jgi:GAF domain-containing protein